MMIFLVPLTVLIAFYENGKGVRYTPAIKVFTAEQAVWALKKSTRRRQKQVCAIYRKSMKSKSTIQKMRTRWNIYLHGAGRYLRGYSVDLLPRLREAIKAVWRKTQS